MRNFPIKLDSASLSLGLAGSMAAWYVLLALSGAVSWGWEALDLTVFRLWATLLSLTLVAGIFESLRRRAHPVRLMICVAGLLLLSCGAYAYLFRFEGVVGLAEGEAYEPIPPVFTSVAKGPLAPLPQLSFSLTRVEPDRKAGCVEVVQQGKMTLFGAAWQGIGASEMRYLRTGLAPLVTVTGAEKGELERSYVKLDLATGKEESFTFETLPYDFYLRKEKAKGQGNAGFHLNVRRGKMSLFDGPVTLGQKAPVQDLTVSIVDERKFALLEIRTRRGLVALQAAAVLFIVVAAAALVRRKEIKKG